MRCGERHRQVLPTNQISVTDVPSRYTHATPVPPLSIMHPMLVTDLTYLFSFFLFFFYIRIWKFLSRFSKFEILYSPKFKNSSLHSVPWNLEISLKLSLFLFWKFLCNFHFPKNLKFPKIWILEIFRSKFKIFQNLRDLRERKFDEFKIFRVRFRATRIMYRISLQFWWSDQLTKETWSLHNTWRYIMVIRRL